MATGLVVGYDNAAAAQLLLHGENGLLARLGSAADCMAAARRLAAVPGEACAMGRRPDSMPRGWTGAVW